MRNEVIICKAICPVPSSSWVVTFRWIQTHALLPPLLGNNSTFSRKTGNQVWPEMNMSDGVVTKTPTNWVWNANYLSMKFIHLHIFFLALDVLTTCTRRTVSGIGLMSLIYILNIELYIRTRGRTGLYPRSGMRAGGHFLSWQNWHLTACVCAAIL